MILVFDLYSPDYVSGGDANFVQTIEHEATNYKHFVDYLAGFSQENNDYIIKNVRVWG